MNPDQTNIKAAGPFPVLAGENLTGLRSRLLVLAHDAGVAEVKLPASNLDLAIYQLCEEGLDATLVSVDPLITGGALRRIPLKSTCNPGEIAVLADVATPADKGKVRKLPATGGLYVQVGVFEEVGVDGQHVLVRPVVKLLHVKSADALTGAADLAAFKAAIVPLLQAHGIVV